MIMIILFSRLPFSPAFILYIVILNVIMSNKKTTKTQLFMIHYKLHHVLFHLVRRRNIDFVPESSIHFDFQ